MRMDNKSSKDGGDNELHSGMLAVNSARAALANAERSLQQVLDGLHSKLAGEIRKQQPNLDVWLDRSGRLKIRYGRRSRELTLYYDPGTGRWAPGPSRFDKIFDKYYSLDLRTGNLTTIAQAVVKFFANNYKSLRSEEK
jgi:flavin-dependent dehydrogenase